MTFASLLRYPQRGRRPCIQWVSRLLRDPVLTPAGQKELEAFRDLLLDMSDHQIEELYARTFDINPAVTLDVGFHLFGLAYKRGEFLVKMQEALREHGIDRGPELADHLPLLLELAAVLPDEDRKVLIAECVAGPVKRMCEASAEQNGYAHVLRALHAYLTRHFDMISYTEENTHDADVAGSW
ncbi:MAG: molecular chaperone TorD family protein [Planctomycetaceae bacterium]|nr:molecular chaperone TorD family protein [Planctomycetaceae bacterium]